MKIRTLIYLLFGFALLLILGALLFSRVGQVSKALKDEPSQSEVGTP